MVAKHNWFFEPSVNRYLCVAFHNLPSANISRATDCEGCGAMVSLDEIYRYEGRNRINSNLHSRNARYPRTKELDTIDKLWHEELRPMADLVGLVEEAAQ